MLSIEEQMRLRKFLEIISGDTPNHPPNHSDVSNRLRDEQGRFLPNESQSRTREEFRSRSIKIVKVKGTYGTYLVKEKLLDERAFYAAITLGTVVVLSVLL